MDLESAHANQVAGLDPVVTVQHFPLLEDLKDEWTPNVDFFEWRLRLNPQLKTLRTHVREWKDIRAISQVLPNLEHLRFEFNGNSYGSSFQGDLIQFPNLKVFQIHGSFRDRAPFVFGNLEEFSCGYFIDELFNSILQNKKLRTISYYDLSDHQFQQIADELPNLEEISTGCDISMNDRMERIAQIIAKSESLRKITFWRMNYAALKKLKLPPDWELIQANGTVYKRNILIRN